MKHFITLILLLGLAQIGRAAYTNNDSTETWTVKADTLLHYAKGQMGVPYKWAACKPGVSFDCSGFTKYAYSKIGVNCPRTSAGLSKIGSEVDIKDCRKGDLILFRGTNPNDQSVGHVGIVVSNDGDQNLQFIHCSSSKMHFGVVITDYYKSGYPKRFIKVKRVIE